MLPVIYCPCSGGSKQRNRNGRSPVYQPTKRQLRKHLDLPALLDAHGVEYEEGSGSWLNCACPICYKNDGHFGLGWNTESGVFSCFSCGKMDRLETIALLIGETPSRTLVELRKYETDINPYPTADRRSRGVLGGVTTLKMPFGTASMTARHKNYLRERDFDPEMLELEWGLLGTGPVGDYKYRIIIPVHQDGKLVCYQGRDVTGKAKAKYLSCPDEKAVVPIKSTLYGVDKAKGDTVVVTEGPSKCWRLGRGAIATFGALVSDEQVKLLTKFKRAFLIPDQDQAGIDGAEHLAGRLSVLGVQTEIISLVVKDVGDLKQEDADWLMEGLMEK